MKRTAPSFCSCVTAFAYLIVLGLAPFPAQALEEGALPASRALQSSLPALAPTLLPLGNEGVGVSGQPLSAAPAPVSIEGSQAAPAAAFSAAEQISAAISQAGQPGGADAAQAASNAAFDNTHAKDSMGGGNAGAGSGDGGSGGGRSDGDGVRNDGLGDFYPRVIFLQDVFATPASDKTVEYLEKVLDAGVHVVFLTHRPLKGAGSAEEILLGRLKDHRTNPIIVASQNGGKISLHGRAANPKSIIDDVGYFPQEHAAILQGVKGGVARSLGLAADALTESELPKDGKAFSYRVSLPATVSKSDAPALLQKMISVYDSELKDAGLAYSMVADPEDPRAGVIYSMPLRFSLPRVYKALIDQFPEENLMRAQHKFLVLADSRRSPKFSSAFSHLAEIQVVRGGADVEETLGASLGDRALPPVSIKLGKLRQFVEYWEPSLRYRNGVGAAAAAPTSEGGGGGRGTETDQKFAQLMGSIVPRLMSWFYEEVFRGRSSLTTLPVLQQRLRDMWAHPTKPEYGIFISKSLAKFLYSPDWIAKKRGYLDHAVAFVTNVYMDEFGGPTTFPLAAQNVMANQVGLDTDAKSLITLEFKSPSTGKVYRIHTRLRRTMRADTAEGRVLTGYAYRTGKLKLGDADKFQAQVMAAALLAGHGRVGSDGKWHQGSPEGPIIGRLRVRFIYLQGARDFDFAPSEVQSLKERAPYSHEDSNGRYFSVELGPDSQQIMNAAEREEADAEFQVYYAEQEQQASEKDLKKEKQPKALKKAAKRKTKSGK